MMYSVQYVIILEVDGKIAYSSSDNWHQNLQNQPRQVYSWGKNLQYTCMSI
jgi:hypothetical protein